MKNNDINNVTEKKQLFSRKILSIVGITLLAVAVGSTAGVSKPDVDIGSSGIQINTGTLDVNGNDIEDAGTTIWDQSNGYIPASSVDQNTIQSGTTASDVGLGSADNADELDLDGSETMTGDLDIGSLAIDNTDEIYEADGSGNQIDLNDVDGGILIKSDSNDNDDITLNSGSGTVNTDSDLEMVGQKLLFTNSLQNHQVQITRDNFSYGNDDVTDGDLEVQSGDDLALRVGGNADSGQEGCIIDDDATINCDGSKNWVHDLENGSEAIYSSQESPEVRAVFEGQTTVTDSKKVQLPSHFSKTVSDTQPKMRAQVTPRGTLTNAAAMEVTDEYIDIKVGKETKVDYRVTGIREGYEDKQVVREKE